MPHSNSLPSPGQIARLRQRLYLVDQVIAPPLEGDSALVALSCVDDDAQGQQLEVLWEREVDAEILTGEAWSAVANRGFDERRLFAAYLNTLRWNCVTATNPKLFQSPFRAGIKLDAYQLEPLRKALLLPRVNLFIADDVGLGKTIEAGLIARELLLRKKAREIVVCCPPSMLLQWKDELQARFGLTFEILDRDYIARARRERGYGVNPWSTHPRFLISQRLLIDESYAGPLRDWLGDFRSGSLLILDEAHHAAPASGYKYAIDSQITRTVRDLAPRFEHRLFLSATPHNGHSNSFSALLEILDPQRFCRGVPVRKQMLDAVMVRRLKDDLRTIQGGFPRRVVRQLDIDGLPAEAPELRLATLLDEYRTVREQRLHSATKRQRAAAGLLIIGLQQRLLSSIEAFARTLRVHRKTVMRHWEQHQADEQSQETSPQAPGILEMSLLAGSIGSDDDMATLDEAELQAEEAAQVEEISAATTPHSHDASAVALFAREQQLLDEMTAIAENARHRPDARLERLLDWIRDRMCPGLRRADGAPSTEPASWTDVRIIIFTEYDDTKRYLQQHLTAALAATERAGERIAIYHGPTPPDEREEIKRAFNADPAKHPLRILIATDAAREGLNLQARCCNLFHFDVPWNPGRMEQRNGRIDRKLQPSPEVYCHYFVYKQRPEDRILEVLVHKTQTIKRELGSLSEVIDARLADTLKGGIRRDSIAALQVAIERADLDDDRRRTVEAELEESRQRQDDLLREVETLQGLLAESQKSIGFDRSHFRAAISCALALQGASPLAVEDGSGQKRYRFPALDDGQGADVSWADTMDTLRAPRERDQKFWDWRRTSPIRPVVFEDNGTLDEGTVHLHLEQRVVQRLLGRFVAQGFVHHDLARACLAHTRDAVPRVILLGRLCLYGEGAARLHEELIPVTARWTNPRVRRGQLTPYARDAETKTMALLEEAIGAEDATAMTETIVAQLRDSARGDVQDLLPHLQARGEEYAHDARQKLTERGAAESRAMREILESQQQHIRATVAKHTNYDARQFRLDFGDNEDELRQLESNKRYWAKRLESLETELHREPQRIREQYAVQATRVEPVGLVYLWPVTG